MASGDDVVVDARRLFRARRLQAEAAENGLGVETYRLIVERLAGEWDADGDAADE